MHTAVYPPQTTTMPKNILTRKCMCNKKPRMLHRNRGSFYKDIENMHQLLTVPPTISSSSLVIACCLLLLY